MILNFYNICIVFWIVTVKSGYISANDSSSSYAEEGSSHDHEENSIISVNNSMLNDMKNIISDKTKMLNSEDCMNAAKLKIENEKLKETVTELSVQMTKATSDLKLNILDYIEKIDKLKNENEGLNNTLKDLKQEISNKENENQNLKNQIQEYEHESEDQRSTIESKTRESTELAVKLHGIEVELEETKKELECKKMETCALAQVANETKSQLNKCSQKINLLEQEYNKTRDNYCMLEDKYIHNTTPDVKICINEGITKATNNEHEAIRAEHAYSYKSKCRCSCPPVQKCSNEDSIILKKVVELVGKKFKCKFPKDEKSEKPDDYDEKVNEDVPSNSTTTKTPCFTFRPAVPEIRPESPTKCTEHSIVVVADDNGTNSAYYVENPNDLPKDCTPIQIKPPTGIKKKKFVKKLPPCIYVPGAPEAEKYKDNKITVSGFNCVSIESITIEWEKVHHRIRIFSEKKTTVVENFKIWVNGYKDNAIEIESGRMQSVLLHADSKSLLPAYIMVDEVEASNTGPNTEIVLIDPSSSIVYSKTTVYLMKKPIFNYILPNQISLIITPENGQELVLRSVVVDFLSVKYFLEELVKQPDYAICLNRPWSYSVSDPNLSSKIFKKISIIKTIENPNPVIHGGPFLDDDNTSGGNNILTNLVLDQPAMRLTATYKKDSSVSIDCRLSEKTDLELLKVIKDSIPALSINVIGK